MSLLESPQAQALLDEGTVEAADLYGCRARLTRFLARYLPLFYRKEQRQNACLVVSGLLSDLERKTCEPIARSHGVERKPIQFFVGAGKWDDEAVMGELRADVVAQRGDPHGILIYDGSTFPKKGGASCGVKRQWCGRLGKTENCQAAVFLAYATARGYAPLDRRLYLPEDLAGDAAHRRKTHVPPTVRYRAKWRIALGMLEAYGRDVPHGWITADEEFGRISPFRAALRARGEAYALEVPANTLVRDLERRPPRRRQATGRPRRTPWQSAADWAARQPASHWQSFLIREGTKGPLRVLALTVRVQTRQEGKVGGEERLVVFKSQEDTSRVVYALCHAPAHTPLEELLRVLAARHHIEELFEAAKGEAGLAHYEVRSWTGWHHHVTLSLLALWFLLQERERLGEKSAGPHGSADALPLLAAAS